VGNLRERDHLGDKGVDVRTAFVKAVMKPVYIKCEKILH